MIVAPTPKDEAARQRALLAYEILDTPAEEAFDALVRLASDLCEAPIALMSLLDADRQFFKSSIGLDDREAPRSTSFCGHAIAEPEILLVPDACLDERFSDNPCVTSSPHVRLYAGVPLRTPDGHGLGTLCVIDRVPRRLSSFQLRALRTLARQVEVQLELRRRLRDLARVQRQKDELAAFLVHDLKNPLTALLPNAQYLAQEPGSDDARLAARDIADAAQAMHRMVLDLLDVSRAEDGTLVPSPARIDVAQFLDQIAATTARRARDRGCDLVATTLPGLGSIHADPDLVRRILENLVDNSLRHTRSGGSVRLHATAAGDEVHLRVCDEGPGIPLAHRERIFDKYVQLDHSATRTGSNRGLGLTFCRLAAVAHGGRIWVEDNLPRGSAFVLSLPRGA